MDLPNTQNWFDRLTRFHVFIIFAFLGLLAYSNAVNHPFVHDDFVFIEYNRNIGSLNPEQVFASTSMADIDKPYVNQYYRPLLEMINRVLYRIVRVDPHGFHFFNIILHIINGFLVYNCVRLVTSGRAGLAMAVGAFFVVHPVQSEAVACVSGVSNLVFAFFCLLSLNCYLMSTRENNNKQLYFLSLALFILALFSKEQSVILPGIVLLYEMCFSKKGFSIARDKWRPIAGFFIVAAGYFILRKFLIGSALSLPLNAIEDYKLILMAIPRSMLVYLSLIFYPHNLHYYRSQDILLPYTGPFLMLGLVAIIAVVLIVLTPRPQKKWMVFGLGWFAISILPTSNILPMVNEYSTILTAEHFLYFPMIGILLFAFGLGHFWVEHKQKNMRRAVSIILLTAIGVVFTGMTARQNEYWRGEIPLFKRTLEFQEGFGRVHILLAHAYAKAGRYEEAVAQNHKAMAIMQNYLKIIKTKSMEGFYEDFIQQIHFQLGFSFERLGDLNASLEHYKKLLDYEPENKFLLNTVAIGHIKINDFQNAAGYFEQILENDENDLMTMNSLALCYQKIGKFDDAENLLRTIVQKDSGSASAKQNLENFLNKRRELNKAQQGAPGDG